MTNNAKGLTAVQKKALAIAALGIAVFIFYFTFVTGDSYVWEDQLYITYPGASYFATSIAEGNFPFWNPGLRGGMPFYTDITMSAFYPLNYVLVLFSFGGELPFTIYQIYLVLHVFLGGLFMYFLLKAHNADDFASTMGGILFAFSGFMSLQFIHAPFIMVFTWLPLAILLVKKFNETRSKKIYIFLILTVLMSFLAGSPQVTVYQSYLIVLYWLFLAVMKLAKEKKKAPEWIKTLLLEIVLIGGAFVSAIVLGAIALIPSAQNWALSNREDFGYAEISDQSLPIKYILDLFFPNFFGTNFPADNTVAFWGINKDTWEYTRYGIAPWQYWEFGSYAGQLGILGLVLVLSRVRKLKERPELLFFAGAAVFALWFMLGRYGGLFYILYHVLPGVSFFRTPARMNGVLNFAMAFLGGMSIHLITRKPAEVEFKKPLLILGGAYILILLVVLISGHKLFPEMVKSSLQNFSVNRILVSTVILGLIFGAVMIIQDPKNDKLKPFIMPFLVILVFTDMYLAYHKFHQGETSPETYYTDPYGLIDQITAQREVYGPLRFAQVYNGALSESLLYPRNMSYFYKDYEVQEGYVLFRTKENFLFQGTTNQNAQSKMDLQNIVFYFDVSSNGVLINDTVLPRAYYFNLVKTYSDPMNVINDLNDQALDYSTTVAVFEDEFEYGDITDMEPLYGQVTIQETEQEEYSIQYLVPYAGVIFISQYYYPGWNAYLEDGTELDVIHTFGAFTGIVLPEGGSGTIRFVFEPRTFKIGAWVSLVSLLLCGGLLFLFARKEKGNAPLTKAE